MKPDQPSTQAMPSEALTWREQEVLSLLAQRLTNREIAARLHLTESTVKDYVSNILGKLYVKNRRQAVERGTELGLVGAGRPAAAEPPTNLPSETTPFIGRSAELEDLRAHLAQTRLLTLTGPGGVGKTRLALKAAADAAGDFSDGSYFVSLAPLPSAEFIVQSIAEAISCPFATEAAPLSQLVRYLKKKQILLVLDNFEHLLDGAALVSQLLQAAPALKILATSREKLNLHSETNLALRGMGLPEGVEADSLHASEAVALFVHCARRVRPAFDPSPAGLQTIAAICHTVQGMPLAIELAAAWLNVLTLDEISAELGRGFDLLATDTRDTPARHRSLRAVFDHSWSLLAAEEQAVFMRLAVFRGGFTREAAQPVAGASLPVLGGLVNKSVLLYRSGRFEIHAVLRQYALERLTAAPAEDEAVHAAHAAYYAEFMQQRRQPLRDGRQAAALKDIEADLENVRAAWRYHIQRADAPRLRQYLDSFWLVCWVRGWNLTAVNLFGGTVDALPASRGDAVITAVRATAMSHQAFFLAWLGQAERAYALAAESVSLAIRLDDPEALHDAYHGLTLPTYYLNRMDEQREAIAQELRIALDLGDPWRIALAHFLSALSSLRDGDDSGAERFAEASLAAGEASADLTLQTLALNTLGHVAMWRADYPAAEGYFQRSLRTAQQLGFRWAVGNVIKYLGRVALRRGALAEAESYFRQSLKIADELGLDRDIAIHLAEFARLRAAQDRQADAVAIASLLLRLPPSHYLDRMGGVRIRENAEQLLAALEPELPPAVFAENLNRGRSAQPDQFLAELLAPRRAGPE